MADLDMEEVEEEDIVPFALTPAVAVQGVIDYNTTEGQKLYSTAIYKLDDELYDCKPDGLYQFLQTLSNRAQEYGWSDKVGGILLIPLQPLDVESETNYLIDNYGMIALKEIRAFNNTYIFDLHKIASCYLKVLDEFDLRGR